MKFLRLRNLIIYKLLLCLIIIGKLEISNAIPTYSSCHLQLVAEINLTSTNHADPFNTSTLNTELPNPEEINLKKSEVRRAYAKNYIFANLMFPQFSSGIVSSIVSYYFYNQISFQDMLDTFKKDHEYEHIAKAMNAAHEAHGVKVITLDQLDDILSAFELRARYAIKNTFVYFLPSKIKYAGKSIEELEQLLQSDVELQNAVEKLKVYVSSVIQILKSEGARETSKRYKEELKHANAVSHTLRNQIIFKYSQELTILMVSKLEELHPELREMESNPKFPNGLKKTKAYYFWNTISKTGLEHMGI